MSIARVENGSTSSSTSDEITGRPDCESVLSVGDARRLRSASLTWSATGGR